MKRTAEVQSRLFISLSCTCILLFFIHKPGVHAQPSSFRKEFMALSKANEFVAAETLVRNNGDIIPREVGALLLEATAEENKFEERIELLDSALRMATMYYYIHGGSKAVIKEIDKLKRTEVRKQEAKIAEETKWEKEEKRLLGNFIMRDRIKEMEEQGLAPVVYPHWIHRIYFKCKACHERIFIKKRGANNISQNQIVEGKQCGVCHNGTVAFGANKECERCHIAGKPESYRLFDARNVDHSHIKEVASRLGAEWNIENMADKSIPLDRFGYIDWKKLRVMNVINPVSTAPSTEELREEKRDTVIFFEAISLTVPDVLFDHKEHAWWVTCSTCHDRIFKDKLGANDVKMIDNARGKFCGDCHSRVAFTFADCLACHNQPKGEPPKGALFRTQPAAISPFPVNDRQRVQPSLKK